MKAYPEKIESIEENEVFVFGSNKYGLHIGGAARMANEKFGAIMGQGHGLQGKSYAIDTMSGIDVLKSEIEKFIKYACQSKNATVYFLVTEIGCGIAGYSVGDIAPLFKDFPENIRLPKRFIDYLEK